MEIRLGTGLRSHMEICSGAKLRSHSEIVHNDRFCPLCEMLGLLEDKEREIEKLNEEEN